MIEKSSLDDLTIEELEEVLQAKRRAQATERFRRVAAEEERKISPVGQGGIGSRPRSAERRTDRIGGRKAYSGRRSSPSAQDKPAVQGDTGEDASAFKAVRIRPINALSSNAPSFLARLNASLWHRGLPRLRDRLLLLLELTALAGLILVVFSSLSNLQVLNREAAEALESDPMGTATITTVALLPGASVPPTSEEQVPKAYRHLVEPGITIPIPTAGPRQASRIVVPAIGVDAPIVEGDGWEDLKMGAGHHVGSANPGERGNMVISGHNDVYGEIFRDLQDLMIGDEVTVYAGDVPYRYEAVAKRVVEPTEVSLLEPTPNATVTLITCYPYLIDTHRLVVIAELSNQ